MSSPLQPEQFGSHALPDPQGEFGPDHADMIRWWSTTRPQSLDQSAMERYGVRGHRAAQVVQALLSRPEALAYNNGEVAPHVNRLLRVRDARAAARSARRLGTQ